jgi:4-amino-4-deoxy-L-arabinose transferase-like glycosyltransferase
MAALLFLLLRKLTGKPILARWMALLSLLTPSLFLYARVSYSEASCYPFFLVLALWCLLRFEEAPSSRTAALAGLALGISAYAYTTARLIAPLMVAATALCFFPRRELRRRLLPFLGAAVLAGAPMGIYMLANPGKLQQRFATLSAFANHPSAATAAARVFQTYFQHLAGTDFLVRTGQHNLWHNIGYGLLPIWLWLPLTLGLYSLWRRRGSAFVRLLAAALIIAPIPVSLTYENLPHTSRFLHFVPLALIVGTLAIADALDAARPDRGLVALACAVALSEGAVYLNDYFINYPRQIEENESNLMLGFDQGMGRALQIAFRARQGEGSICLPDSFFTWYGTYPKFYGDLDPVRVRKVRLDGVGIHSLKPWPLDSGSIFVLPGSTVPPQSAQPLGTSDRLKGAEPFWSIYRAQ